MLRTLLKYAIWLICIYGAYKALEHYSAYKIFDYEQECHLKTNMCALKSKSTNSDEVIKVMNDGFQCIANKQTWLEKQIIDMSKLTGFENNNNFRKAYKQKLEELRC